MEDSEKPSFENFLSKPTTLTDHLMWQLGSLHVNEDVYRAAELVIGNLNEEGYLSATDDELLGLADEEQPLSLEPPSPEPPAPEEDAPGLAVTAAMSAPYVPEAGPAAELAGSTVAVAEAVVVIGEEPAPSAESVDPRLPRPALVPPRSQPSRVPFSRDALREAIDLVKQMDPIGVGARDLRECLLAQLQIAEAA